MGLFDKFFNKKQNALNTENMLDLEVLMVDWFSDGKLSYNEYNTNFYPQVVKIFLNNKYFIRAIDDTEEEKYNLDLNIAFIYLIYHFPDKKLLKRLYDVFRDNSIQPRPRNYFGWNLNANDYSTNPDFEPIKKTVSYIWNVFNNHLNDGNLFHDTYKFCNLKTTFPTAFIRVMDFARDLKLDNALYTLLELYSYKDTDYSTGELKPLADGVQDAIKERLLNEIEIFNQNDFIQLDLALYQEFYDLFHYKKGCNKQNNSVLTIPGFPALVRFINKNDIGVLVKYFLLSLNIKTYYKDTFIADLVIYLEKKLKPTEELLSHFFSIYSNFDEVLIEKLYFPIAKKIQLQYDSKVTAQLEDIVVRNLSKAAHLKFFKELANTIPNEIEKEINKAKHAGGFAKMNTAYGWTSFLSGDKNKFLKSCFKEITKIINLSLITTKSGYFDDGYRTIIEINLNGKKQKIKFENINTVLYDEKTGYQLVPIPIKVTDIIKNKYSDGKEYLCGLAFLNKKQYDYLLDEFLPKKFDKIDTEKFYTKYIYSHENPLIFEDYVKEISKGASTNKFLADNNWKWFKEKYVDKLPTATSWYDLMEVIISYSGSKKPTKKWLKQISTAIKKHGEILFFKELRTLIDNSIKEDFWYFDTNRNALKGIAWSCTLTDDSISLIILKEIIAKSYTKVPGVGPRSGAVGNTALEALVNHTNSNSFGILNLLRNQTKYARFAKALEKSIDRYIENSDEEEQALADKAIPDFDFVNGEKIVVYPSFSVKYILQNKKLIKKWIVDEKEVKTTPPLIKQKYPKLIREIAAESKSINAFFKLTKSRIQSYWLNNRKWTFNNWTENVKQKELLNPWLNGLVWKNETQNTSFILLDNLILNEDKKAISIDNTDIISLWHPMISDKTEILNWQNFIIEHKVEQVERQVFREFYPFSENESKMDDSPRFNHHFLQVRKLMAVANSAGWLFTYVHEDVSWPRTYIKALDITAHLKCDYDRNDFAIPTKGFYISKGDTSKITYNLKYDKIPFSEVPKITLSEICRNIDLFIATTSVAHDVELSEQTELLKTYRNDFSMGKFSDNAQAKIRKQIIGLIGKKVGLKQFSFEKNYLLIDGSRNEYQINLGSGFAQLQTTKRHIPLMPNTSTIKKKVNKVIALKDDETLYIILAKALFLQNDTKTNY